MWERGGPHLSMWSPFPLSPEEFTRLDLIELFRVLPNSEFQTPELLELILQRLGNLIQVIRICARNERLRGVCASRSSNFVPHDLLDREDDGSQFVVELFLFFGKFSFSHGDHSHLSFYFHNYSI